MFSVLLESYGWVKAHNPLKAITGVKTVRLNFITIHCTLERRRDNADRTLIRLDLYIVFLAITCSIIIYPAAGLNYIDALFFGSGCATQSGLNTC